MTRVDVNVHLGDPAEIWGALRVAGGAHYGVLHLGTLTVFTEYGREAILKATADIRRALDTIRDQLIREEWELAKMTPDLRESPGLADLAQREADESAAEAAAERYADNDMPADDVR